MKDEILIGDLSGTMFVHEIRRAVFVTWVAREHVEMASRFPKSREAEFVEFFHKFTGIVCKSVPVSEVVPELAPELAPVMRGELSDKMRNELSWSHNQPPNEEWVEVRDGDNVAIAQAFHGRDGYKPHWVLLDGKHVEPVAFREWRYNPRLCQVTGKYKSGG